MLYLVTDDSCRTQRDLLDTVAEAVEGGVDMVQLREKHLDTGPFVERAIALKRILEGTGVPLIINDRVDVALASGADGVHIGQSDMPYDIARRLLGPDAIIGLSVEDLEQARLANALPGLDYVAASPVFATPTKTDTAEPWGLDGLRQCVSTSIHPVIAIGGMNARTARDVMSCGAKGIAVVSAITGAANPREAARQLKELTR